MASDGAKRALKARGVSEGAMRKALAAELKAQGVDGRSWRLLSKATQQGIFKKALDVLKPRKPSGKHAAPFRRIEGGHTASQDLAATNPNHRKGTEWQINCQRCVAAYELRRRGYDVTAKPRPMLGKTKPDPSDTLPNRLDPNGWPSMFEGATLESCASGSGPGTRRKIEALMASYGDGARAIIRIQYQRKYGGYGHVFIAEQRDGRTAFVDPQTGSADCSGYFEKAEKSGTYCVRIDDKPFTDRIRDAAEERK